MANLTSELSAVNTILAATGQASVNSLATARADVKTAQNILHEVSRNVQVEGWNFNTEFNVEFTPDASNEITIPTNTIRCELNAEHESEVHAVVRGTKLYDTKNRRSTFEGALYKATVVYLLDFADLPEAARQYVTIRSARLYQQRFLGSSELSQFTLQEEVIARSNMVRHEADTADYTIFDNNSAMNRRNRKWRS